MAESKELALKSRPDRVWSVNVFTNRYAVVCALVAIQRLERQETGNNLLHNGRLSGIVRLNRGNKGQVLQAEAK